MYISRERMKAISEELANTAFEHGEAGYARGCRGPVCTKRGINKMLHSRAIRKEYAAIHGVPTGVEHGGSCYTNWGCRCETCKAAHADDLLLYRAKQKPLPRDRRVAELISKERQR